MDRDLERKCRDIWDAYMGAITHYLNHAPSNTKEDNFCRDLEDIMGLSEPMVDDFRRMIAAFFFNVYYTKGTVTWDANPKLAEGIIKYLKSFPFENVPEVSANPWLGVTGKYRSIDDE